MSSKCSDKEQLLRNAAWQGEKEEIRTILRDGGVDVNSTTKSLNTALHYAASGVQDGGVGAGNIVQQLLEAGADLVSQFYP